MHITRPVSHLLAACLFGIVLPALNPALAAESYITRSPAPGEHFRKAGPNDAVPATSCTHYVPAYSNIYLFESGSIPLAINLSIRNTDAGRSVYIKQIDYYTASGKLIETVLAEPWLLAPMATATYVIDQHDMRGGAGANFIVQWAATGDAEPPLIETVMAGYRGSKGMSFNSRGIAQGDCGAD